MTNYNKMRGPRLGILQASVHYFGAECATIGLFRLLITRGPFFFFIGLEIVLVEPSHIRMIAEAARGDNSEGPEKPFQGHFGWRV